MTMKKWEKISIVGGLVGLGIAFIEWNIPDITAVCFVFAMFTAAVEVVED